MKKIVYFIIFVLGAITLVSCEKKDAQKDVEVCISKLDQFNAKFAELYTDNQISKDTLEGQKTSEYDVLKKMATEYYDVMNKINTSVEAEQTAKAEGDEIEGYEDAYKLALETNMSKIESSTKLFETNLLIISGKSCDVPSVEIKIEEVQKAQILSIRKNIEMKNIGTEMGIMYGELMSFIGKSNFQMAGVPVAIYHVWSDSINDVECGIPVSGVVTGNDKIKVSETYTGKVVTALHIGPYDKVVNTWVEIDNYLKSNNLEISGAPWEEYITDPATEPDSTKWQTKIYQPVK